MSNRKGEYIHMYVIINPALSEDLSVIDYRADNDVRTRTIEYVIDSCKGALKPFYEAKQQLGGLITFAIDKRGNAYLLSKLNENSKEDMDALAKAELFLMGRPGCTNVITASDSRPERQDIETIIIYDTMRCLDYRRCPYGITILEATNISPRVLNAKLYLLSPIFLYVEEHRLLALMKTLKEFGMISIYGACPNLGSIYDRLRKNVQK